MRQALTTMTAALAGVLLCAGCSASGADTPAPSASVTADARATAASAAPSTAPADATQEAAIAFWDEVAGLDDEITGVISEELGEDFHARLGSQDTGVALATLASAQLGWKLDAGMVQTADVSDRESLVRGAIDDPASIGQDSAGAIRATAFRRYGSEDSRDYAREMCRILTDGTRAELIASVADAADASRTDVASPAVTGAGLAPVVCPEMTDEYLAALHELADGS